MEALHRQIDELQQANDKLDKSESYYYRYRALFPKVILRGFRFRGFRVGIVVQRKNWTTGRAETTFVNMEVLQEEETSQCSAHFPRVIRISALINDYDI